MTRGPLPARVYWVRRMLVLGFALLLVVGIARVLGSGSDGSSAPDRATQVAADSTPSSPTSPTSPTARQTGKDKQPGEGKSSKVPPLALPSGPCQDGDVAVTPQIKRAVAGRDIFIVLSLRTLESEACTWRVSPTNLTVKVTSGKDDIWTSRECPRAIPVRDVVVRKDVTTTVGLTWNSRRSDEGCSRLTEWALPGYYHIAASALGGEPSDLQFRLATPTAAVVTRTAEPTQQPDPEGNGGKHKNKHRN